jgi:hypothetical protein
MIGWSRDARAMSVPAANVHFSSPPADYDRSWEALRVAWFERLTVLATEFRDGVADVQPRDAQACAECDLHALCRIRDRGRYDVE